jgi:paraquat-inducible protein B
MSNEPPPSDYSDLPEAVTMPKRDWSPQLVWIIPIIAVVVGGWLAVKAVFEQGPTIRIIFRSAEGLEAGKTKIKYKNVDVGEVKSIAFIEDLSRIVVTAEMVKGVAPHLVEDTRFWIVKPRIAGGQVTGLGTLFSGSYIEADIGKSTGPRREFVGLETSPVVTRDVPGRHFILHSDGLGTLEIGEPLFFRHIKVGDVVSRELNKDGKGVTFKIFVEAPYDQYVNLDTRFWNASGIDMVIDSNGIKVDTQSIVSILIGGIAFATPTESSSLQPAEDNTEFTLHETREAAMKHLDRDTIPGLLYFTESLRGLSPGAPVDFRGITIGEVKSVTVEFDDATTEFKFPVEIVIYPDRLRSRLRDGFQITRTAGAERRARFDKFVERGLRYQLRSGNLLTGQLYVAGDFFPDAPKATINWTTNPPVLPTIPGKLEELQSALTALARKLERMPLEGLGSDLRQTLQALNRTLDRADSFVKRLDTEVAPAALTALGDARRTLNTVERTFASDAPLHQDTREALRELARAGRSLRTLADLLERHPESLIRGKAKDNNR